MSTLFTDVMTVYNYWRNPDTGKEIWNRNVVRGIQWSHNKIEVTTTDGVQTKSQVERITIDFQRLHGNKLYLSPNKYNKLPEDEFLDYWTLDAKSGKDILVFGKSEKEINQEYRLSDLMKDFQYVVTVTAVSDNRNRRQLKNIKVVGK